MKAIALFLSISVFFVNVANAAVKAENIAYKEGKTVLEGYMAYDDGAKEKSPAKKPGVLIIHQWMGLSDNEKMRAQMLAEKGYVVFAVDIYGKGNRPTNMEEAGKFAGTYKNDTKLFRKRALAGLEVLKSNSKVDPKKVVVMGYCFGGTGALEVARSGAKVAGIASFHGGLANKHPEDAKKIKEPVLVMHGAVDPFVPATEVDAFKKEMDAAKAKYEFIAYDGAVHAFTQKEAGSDPTKGMAYNEAADKKSWDDFLAFMNRVAPL